MYQSHQKHVASYIEFPFVIQKRLVDVLLNYEGFLLVVTT